MPTANKIPIFNIINVANNENHNFQIDLKYTEMTGIPNKHKQST